jgi:hypothetical protein
MNVRPRGIPGLAPVEIARQFTNGNCVISIQLRSLSDERLVARNKRRI